MQGFPVPEQAFLYDPHMARVCGGAASALVFCWLENEFLSGQLSPKPDIRYKWREMADRLGMRPSQFSKAFFQIGTIYRSPSLYRRAVLSGHEFWHTEFRRNAFYSLEITERKGITIVRRNARAIDQALHYDQQRLIAPIITETSARAKAAEDAKRLLGI